MGGAALWRLSDAKSDKTECCGIAGVIATSKYDAR
jgi:hypothetical protein